jgi:hypothetical protein
VRVGSRAVQELDPSASFWARREKTAGVKPFMAPPTKQAANYVVLITATEAA